MLDSGASIHVTNNLSDFTDYKEKLDLAMTATDDKAVIQGSGTVHLQITNNGQPQTMKLDNIPKLSSKIISAGYLCTKGYNYQESLTDEMVMTSGNLWSLLKH